MRIIDTHLHLVDRSRFSYPWLQDVPPLQRDWPLPLYWTEAEPLGIAAAIHMEVDVAAADRAAETRWAAEIGPPVTAVVAACRPEERAFPADLERLAAMPKVRGLRRILHTSPDELSQHRLFAENLRRLPATGLTFDLCVLARQLPLAAALIRACPDTQFILDHCGVPDIAGQPLDPWRADIAAAAALPNVVCKISGVVAYAGTDWTAATLRPFVEHCIDIFGWDRVVWGSDWPVCTTTADLGRWVAATRDIIAGADAADQAKLLSRNAERVYRMPAGLSPAAPAPEDV